MRAWRLAGVRVAVAVCCLLVKGAVGADSEQAGQDFDAWPVTWSWDVLGDSPVGTYTNGGWLLQDGRLSKGKPPLWASKSGSHFAWLRDYDESTNSFLRSPWLPNGVGTVSLWAVNRLSTGVNVFALEFSTNGVAWQRLATLTNTTSFLNWKLYSHELADWTPGYLRVLKLADTAADQRLGLDDVVIYDPPGVALSSLSHGPVAPTIDDPVHISVSAKFHPNATNRQVRAWYHFEEDPNYSYRPMVLTTGDIYRTETPIPAGRAGTVFYYVSATYSGVDEGTYYWPLGGPTNPASYASTDPQGSSPNPRQYGPSSQFTPLIISEIMYHPVARVDGLNLEFVELYNSDPLEHDIGGYRVSGEIDYTFPTGTVLAGGGRVVVAADPHAVSTEYPVSGVLGPWKGNLSNGGGTVRLRNREDAVLLDMEYDDRLPWPIETDGAGHSLVCAKPDYGEGDVRAWAASGRIGGSPGYALPAQTNGLRNVVINEFLAHTDLPQTDFIELHNTHAQGVDISGCVLTDDPASNKFVIPATTIPANGHTWFDQATLGFSLSMSGDDIYLVDPAGTYVIDAVRFSAQSNGVATGRSPDGSPDFHVLATNTPGSANAGLKIADIVINEIMYHPISGYERDEYVELHNKGGSSVDVGYWRFVDGIDYMIPPGTVIPAGGFLVVARDKTNLLARYPHLNATNTVGDYSGQLSDRGERVALAKPDDLQSPFQDFVVIDEVTYGDGWADWTDGGGSSLELTDARSDNRMKMNWRASDETQKAPWTTIEYTDSIDYGTGGTTPFQIWALLPGEYIVDDIVLTTGSTPNLQNDFESGAGGWSFIGSHMTSAVEPGVGFGGSAGLHIRATERGEFSGADGRFVNHAETAMSVAPTSGQVMSIRAKVRWLKGYPFMTMGCRGYWWATPGDMDLHTDMGSPGQPNGGIGNSGPALADVQHQPVLPLTFEPVVVTARVHDPDGISSIVLKYRNDSTAPTVINSLSMLDNGTGGDATAGDGVYSATIPGQAANNLVAFTIESTDAAGSAASSRYPTKVFTKAPPSECLVCWGLPAPKKSGIRTYRILMTAANNSRLASYGGYSKELIDATYLYEDLRAVYNTGARYRAGVSVSGYVLRLPKDERVIGANKFSIFAGAVVWRTAYLPYMCAALGEVAPIIQPIAFAYGTGGIQLLSDFLTPSTDLCGAWFGDDDPEVFKNQDWSKDGFGLYKNQFGEMKRSAYAGLQTKRGVLHPNNDYSQVFKIATTVATADASDYVARVASVIDIRSWASFFALCGILGDTDHYGYTYVHNYYVYIPRHGRSHLMAYDMDWSFNGSGVVRWPTGHPIPRRMFTETPTFMRQYWSVLRDTAQGPMLPEKNDAWFDDWYAVFLANGLNPGEPEIYKRSVASDRAAILAGLAGIEAPLEITSGGGVDFTTAQNPVALTGTTPVYVEEIRINNEPYKITYTGLTSWQTQVWLDPGANVLNANGYDYSGALASNGTDTITITYTGPLVTRAGKLVINEIMYNASGPYAAFVEIANISTKTLELGGLRVNGVDCVIGRGNMIAPGGFAVIAGNTPGYQAAYSNAEVVAAEFSGSLDNGGETLQLLMPDGTNWIVIDEVAYDDDPPWPAADGTGPSLQLRDASRDNDRVANWGIDPVALYTPGRANSIATSLPEIPRVWINEIMPSNTSFVADAALDFDPWVELYNAEVGAIDLSGYYLTDSYTNLTRWAVPGGWSIDAGDYQLIWADGETNETTGTELHAGFRMNSVSGTVALVWTGAGEPLVLDALDYEGVPANNSYGSYPDGDRSLRHIFHYPTPATANNPTSVVVALCINEWMARNSTTLENPDSEGAFDDWFELLNLGAEPVNLTGFTLSDNASWPDKFTIPLGTTLPAGEFVVVWADEEGDLNAPGSIHANFKLDGGGEMIGLYAPDGSLLDTVTFGAQLVDISEGRWPDADHAVWQMAIPTPGAPNVVLRVEDIAPTTNGQLRLSWPTRPGSVYRVWGVDSLLPSNTPWQVYGSPQTATVSSLSADVPTGTNAPGFYRITQE